MVKENPSLHRDETDNSGAAKAVRGPGRRLHGAIAHKLGMAILSGQYAPGDTLSGEGASEDARCRDLDSRVVFRYLGGNENWETEGKVEGASPERGSLA